MFSVDSVAYPIAGIIITVLSAMIIKLVFHSNQRLKNHRKPDFTGHLQAYYYHNRSIVFILFITASIGYLTWQIWSILLGFAPQFRPFYIILGLSFIVQILISSFSKQYRHRSHGDIKDNFNTIVIVPVYNEDEDSLRECLLSIFNQTRKVEQIHVVNDGSRVNYDDIEKWFSANSKKMNINYSWTNQKNGGKRSAHITALSKAKIDESSIIVTIDSDGYLDSRAIEEGLVPFADPHIMSVAGLVIAKNAQVNLLARITDNLFVAGQQLIDRAFMSQFGSVLVNSGGLAFYRSSVIGKSLDSGYDEEKFFGNDVKFSDDSYFTLFALLNGRAVQQPSSIVFADMPIKLSHHIRQQLRWARGSFIRSWWRIKHLSFGSFGFVRQVVGWVIFVLLFIITLQILIFIPIESGKMPPVQIILIPLMFSYLQAARYLSVRRSDMTTFSQLVTVALAPLAMLWSVLVIRSIRLYGMITCYKTGWGTRQEIETVRKIN